MMKSPPSVVPVLVLAMLTALAPRARAQSIEQKAQVCAACHGDHGIPQQQGYPVIWGQHLGYLYLQLRDFKAGARKNDLMAPIVATLERDDMMALAKYFSEKPWPRQQQASAATASAQAQRTNETLGCTGCHQDGFLGEGTQPRLAGQNKDYLAKTMADFRSDARKNNTGMSELMKTMPPGELAPLAEYLAGL